MPNQHSSNWQDRSRGGNGGERGLICASSSHVISKVRAVQGGGRQEAEGLGVTNKDNSQQCHCMICSPCIIVLIVLMLHRCAGG